MAPPDDAMTMDDDPDDPRPGLRYVGYVRRRTVEWVESSGSIARAGRAAAGSSRSTATTSKSTTNGWLIGNAFHRKETLLFIVRIPNSYRHVSVSKVKRTPPCPHHYMYRCVRRLGCHRESLCHYR